jgi:hypothetical protein
VRNDSPPAALNPLFVECCVCVSLPSPPRVIPSTSSFAISGSLEGIVSNRKDGRYRSGRSPNWTKVTCRKRDTFVVAGIAYKGNKFDGIYLGRRDEEGLTYAGKVEHGFSAAQQKALMSRAAKLVATTQPLAKKIAKPKAKWLRPMLLAMWNAERRRARENFATPHIRGCERISESQKNVGFESSIGTARQVQR